MRITTFSLNSPNKHLTAQSQQYKHQKKTSNMFKVNNKILRLTSLTSFWCLTVKFDHISHLFLGILLLPLSC